MKIKQVSFFLLFLFTAFANAQNAKDIIDGLKKDLKSNPDDKKRATIYSDLTWYYSDISIDSSVFYGDKAIYEAKKINDDILVSQVYSDLGAVYTKKSDYQKAEEFYHKSYEIRKAKNDKKGMAKINSNLGNIYQSVGKYQLSMQTYLDASTYFSSINDETQVHVIKGNIAALCYELKNYSKALNYSNEVLNYFEKNKMQDKMCRNYLIKGNILLALHDTVAATKAFNRSLLMCQKIGDNFTVSKAINNLGVIKQNENKLKESKILFDKVNLQRKIYNSEGATAKSKLNIAYSLYLEHKYEEAKTVLLHANEFFKEKKLDAELTDSYKYLVPIYAKLKLPDSVIYYQSLFQANLEKTTKLDVIKQTLELETKYDTVKKEKLILENEAKLKQQQTIIYSILFLIFLFGIIGYLLVKQQKLKNTQQEQEFKLKSAISKIETQNKLQEQRLSISRDLHDNIGAQLTFIISSVENVKYGFDINNEKLSNKLTNISSFAKETIVELRDTIWAMNSNEISFEDLEGRIHNFIEKAKEATADITFSFEIDENLKAKKLSSVEGMNVYRTIQEAINNSLKYANAKNIKIEAIQDENQTKITISDDGIGFNEAEINYGNGLNNMKKRIEEIGGKLAVSSSEKGTSIEVLI